MNKFKISVGLMALVVAVMLVIGFGSPDQALATGQETCPSGNGWHKVDGIDAQSYTYDAGAGNIVVEWCYKAGRTLRWGTANSQVVTLTSDVPNPQNNAYKDISHASFKIRQERPPEPDPYWEHEVRYECRALDEWIPLGAENWEVEPGELQDYPCGATGETIQYGTHMKWEIGYKRYVSHEWDGQQWEEVYGDWIFEYAENTGEFCETEEETVYYPHECPPSFMEYDQREECRQNDNNVEVNERDFEPGQSWRDREFPCGATVVRTRTWGDHYVIYLEREVSWTWDSQAQEWVETPGEWVETGEEYVGPCDEDIQFEVKEWECPVPYTNERRREECRENAENTQTRTGDVEPGGSFQQVTYDCGATVTAVRTWGDHYIVYESQEVTWEWNSEASEWQEVLGEWTFVSEEYTGPCDEDTRYRIVEWVCPVGGREFRDYLECRSEPTHVEMWDVHHAAGEPGWEHGGVSHYTRTWNDTVRVYQGRTFSWEWNHDLYEWVPVYGDWITVDEAVEGICNENVVHEDVPNNPFVFCFVLGSEGWVDGNYAVYGNEIVHRTAEGWFDISPFDVSQFPVGSEIPISLNGEPFVSATYQGNSVCTIPVPEVPEDETEVCEYCGPWVDEAPVNGSRVILWNELQFIENAVPFTVDGEPASMRVFDGVEVYYAYGVPANADVVGLPDDIVTYSACSISVHWTQADGTLELFDIMVLPGQWESEWILFGRRMNMTEDYIQNVLLEAVQDAEYGDVVTLSPEYND